MNRFPFSQYLKLTKINTQIIKKSRNSQKGLVLNLLNSEIGLSFLSKQGKSNLDLFLQKCQANLCNIDQFNLLINSDQTLKFSRISSNFLLLHSQKAIDLVLPISSVPYPIVAILQSLYNNFTMNRKQLLAIYLNLQGRLQKKSTSFFIGFQEKDWKILQNGTKIGYKNLNDPFYLPEKTYKLTEVHTQQVEEECVFLIHTPSRVYELRAATEELRKVWMRAITALKKEIKRKNRQEMEEKKVKPVQIVNNHNDSTLPSIDPFHQLNMTSSNLHQTVPPRFTYGTASKLSSQLYGSKSMIEDQLKEKFKDYLKKMAPSYIHYHVFIAKLTTKSKDFFMTNSASHYYILFSSKSLIPEEYISQENLTSAQLPHWADPDQFYRLSDDKDNCKSIFHMNMITDIIETDSASSIKIVTQGQTYQFFCDTLVAVKKMKEAMEVGRVNALESQEGDSKKNYDNLILLHTSNLQLFNERVNQMIAPFQPDGKDYEPQVVKKFIENISPIIIEVLDILQNKVKIPTNTIVEFVRIIHDQVRKHLKLMWITSYQKVKGGDILNILKSVSRYQSLVNKYVKDLELDDALKELSKFYMRICYKNFESIILGIVTQEKKDNYFIEDQEGAQPFYETHGVTDLFKFIYDVFEIAIPCWNNKLHLHNINRLIKRALAIFIKELKATVDEEDISTNELVAIANNYIKFNEEVEQFYDSKLSQLKEQTKVSYDELKNQYREIAMIVIDKMVLPLKLQLKIYFEKQNFYTASMEDAYKKIVESKIRENTRYAHFVLKKKYFQRIFSTIREEICKMLEKESKKMGKKKPQLNKVIDRIESYKKDCIDMGDLLYKQKLRLISKEFDELKLLLTSPKKEEVKIILSGSSEFFKRVYKNILLFRADYVEGSPLHVYINSAEQETSKELNTPQDKDRRRSSFSKYYIQEWDRNSITSTIEKDKMGEREKSQIGEEKIKMISEGYVRRTKNGSSEEIYLKLKKSVLYIYENDRMERCQNTIQIQDIIEVTMPSPEKPLFVIVFSALNRSKQMRIKCQTLEQCSRWVYSLQLQLRRISNDKKIKSKGIKIKDKKSKLIIDFDEVERGKTDYFSYNL